MEDKMEKKYYNKISKKNGWGYAVVSRNVDDEGVYGQGWTIEEAWRSGREFAPLQRGERLKSKFQVIPATPAAMDLLRECGYVDGLLNIVRFDEMTTVEPLDSASIDYLRDETGKKYLPYDYVVDIYEGHEDEAADYVRRIREKKQTVN